MTLPGCPDSFTFPYSTAFRRAGAVTPESHRIEEPNVSDSTPSDPSSSELHEELRSAMNQARRDRDRLRRTVLSSALSEIRNREIEVGRALDDEGVREVLARGVKQRREAATQMRDGGRPELAEREETEAAILGEFLPPELSEEEVRALVREIIESGADEMGPLMGRLMPRIKGRFDGKAASRIVREELEA